MSADFDFTGDLTEDYEKVHDQVPGAGGDSRYFYNCHMADVRRLVKNRKVESVLDFGCGRGRLTHMLADEYPTATLMGTDISPQSVEVAQKRFPHPRITYHLNPPVDARFDLIVASGVFHHILPEEQLAVMRSLANNLNPGGMMIIFEHNPLNPVTQYIVAHEPFDFVSYLLKPWRLTMLMRKAGLKVTALRFTTFFPARLSFLLPLTPLLQWLPLGGQYLAAATKDA
jgi:2-polyprenyl-3-methyl-5-hydroxy-6-metoxy-1,4-benzoquinol methylase